ncbi:MAG: hypothetical protein O6826_05185, partial [Acidobacteria bacterium]|nr:hypothetical protein [Acidobacteriota bacterium]
MRGAAQVFSSDFAFGVYPMLSGTPLNRVPIVGQVEIFGSVADPSGDASPSENDDPDPDVISATVTSDGINLTLTVRYAPGTFDPQLTQAVFLFDTDQDPNTGHPGSDS